jgi:beta-carotene ketolase (CrtW type)
MNQAEQFFSIETVKTKHFINHQLAHTDSINGTNNGTKGLFIALIILVLWFGHLIFWFSLDITQLHNGWLIEAIAVQTFLYSGLFINAHDAMHRSLYPQNHRINDAVGTLCVFLYAFFSYKKLLKKHALHHRHPATELDPDFHNSRYKNLIAWYFRFFKQYWGLPQFILSPTVYYTLHFTLHIPEISLVLFWVVPSILSSAQLFYFGTFLTHREPEQGYTNQHCAHSSSLPVIWSFFTCYHFGYHEEHHSYPSAPWWQLPVVRRLRLATDSQQS